MQAPHSSQTSPVLCNPVEHFLCSLLSVPFGDQDSSLAVKTLEDRSFPSGLLGVMVTGATPVSTPRGSDPAIGKVLNGTHLHRMLPPTWHFSCAFSWLSPCSPGQWVPWSPQFLLCDVHSCLSFAVNCIPSNVTPYGIVCHGHKHSLSPCWRHCGQGRQTYVEYESMSENLCGGSDPVQQTRLLGLLDERSHNGNSFALLLAGQTFSGS